MNAVSIKAYSNKENAVVNTTVFFILWSFFHGFPFLFGGTFNEFLGGRLSFILIIFQALFFIYTIFTSPSLVSGINRRFVGYFGASLFFMYLLLLVFVGQFDNSIIFSFINVAFLLLLRDDLKVLCLERFIRVITFIFTLSIIEYIVYILTKRGVVVCVDIIVGDNDKEVVNFVNQYLFNFISQLSDMPRFQSLCTEPGDVGTLCGMLLFATPRDKVRKQYIVIVIAGILSFSLAFYAMFAVSLLNGKKLSGMIVVYALLILGVYFFLLDYFNHLIIIRVGGEVVDNRVTEGFSVSFNNALRDGSLLLPHGLGTSFGAGAKMWLWRYGVLSFIPLFASYYSYFKAKVRQYQSHPWYSWVFFLAFWMSFYQRHWILNLDYLIVFLSVPIIYRSVMMPTDQNNNL